MHCPTCNGNIIGDSCLQCGRLVVKIAPYTKRSCEHVYGGKKYKSTSRAPFGTCKNCERPDKYLTRGLCGACYSQVHRNRYGKEVNIPRDSKKYLEVLRAYREKRWPEKFRKVA